MLSLVASQASPEPARPHTLRDLLPADEAARQPATTTAPPLSTRPQADEHPVAVYLARLAPGSRRTMRQALDTVARLLTGDRQDALMLDWPALRYQHSQAVRAELADRYAPATCNKMLAALRGVLQECWRLGLASADDYRRAADVKAVRASGLPRGRALARPELAALFAACAEDPSPAGRRDAALLAVLYTGGLRRSELVALDLADVADDALTVRHGKGDKARVCYLPTTAVSLLASWLTARGELSGPVFLPIVGGRVLLRRLSAQAVYVVLRRRGQQAGIAGFSPHDLRRSFVSDLLDAGVDLSTVQRMAGHSGVATTARYDRRGDRAKRRAAALLDLPEANTT